MDLEGAVRRNREVLAPMARAVTEEGTFSLQLPCALLTNGGVVETTLNGLRSHLPCSVALASAPMERFLLLREEHGFDRAFELCSGDDSEGEAFVNAWDEAQQDLAEGAVMTLNDLVAMVEQAKHGFAARPRRMLVVALEGKKVESGTVPVDWVVRGAG